MADKRITALPVVTVTTAGDKLILDGATTRAMTVESFRLAQGLGVLGTDVATPDDSAALTATANAAAIVAAFATSPYVNLGGRTFYVESIAIPATAKRLFNGTLIAAGVYGGTDAVVNVSANTAGFTLDNVTITVDVATYTTTNGVNLIAGTTGATVSNCSLSGIYPVFIGRATNTRIIGNTFASGTFGRAIFGTCDAAAASTFTVTSASPAVFTKATHGLAVNDTVILYSSGALYTGLTMGRLIYIKTVPTADTFTASLTLGGAAINTSGAQSGTHYYTSNGPVGLYIADNTIYKSASANSQGIVLTGVSDATVTNNIILGSTHFGIASVLGEHNSITDNNVSYTGAEAIHTDSGVNAIISGNVMTFDSTSLDVGVSVSNDNGPPAINAHVIGNSIDSPYGAGIYFVGATGCSAQGNKIRNSNVGDTTLSGSIILDGSATTKCLIGQNTIVDTIANNDYQVGEANYTSGAPSANYIAPQIGPAGLLGRILNVATTDTAIRASNSPASSDTVNGFRFESTPFALRDVGGTNVGIYDYNGTLACVFGSTASPTISWARSTYNFYTNGFGSIPISLTGAVWTSANSAAPSSPSAGSVKVWTDITDLRLHDKNSAGVIGTTVVADTGASNQFLTAISAAGVISKAQPVISDISGLATAWTSYTPTVTAGSGTFTTVSATGFYKQVGKSVTVRIEVIITTNGTAAGRVEATLPAAIAAGTINQVLAAINSSAATGVSAVIAPGISTGKLLFFTTAGAYPGGSGVTLNGQGTYEVP